MAAVCHNSDKTNVVRYKTSHPYPHPMYITTNYPMYITTNYVAIYHKAMDNDHILTK